MKTICERLRPVLFLALGGLTMVEIGHTLPRRDRLHPVFLYQTMLILPVHQPLLV